MNDNYLKLLTKIKEKQTFCNETVLEQIVSNAKKNKKSKKEIEDIVKLYNMLMGSDTEKETKQNIEKIKKTIKYQKEYTIDNITFGVVCLRKIVYGKMEINENKEMIQNKSNVYDTKIIIIDNENEIDNIMVKRYKTKVSAIQYANKLWDSINNKTLNEIVEILDKNIK